MTIYETTIDLERKVNIDTKTKTVREKSKNILWV